MDPFINHKGLVAPLDRSNVDTDQIIPKQFLKRIERTGFGEFAFFDWRYLEPGVLNPDFILNEERYKNASILVSGTNFGSGSSREHAPWALLDYGFKVIIAPSFADIFRNNCFQNGILSIILDKKEVDHIMGMSLSTKNYELNVDLTNEIIYDASGFKTGFKIDPFRRDSLLKGEDEIARTLSSSNHIDSYEKNRIKRW
ncbi:MAG: 3-isopropylmalate dehydratase small subunit [Dehalococcoidia bacterium]|nr:3-isopropylmalate dehydratase small subunit [Dehalococcoidia bacterium]